MTSKQDKNSKIRETKGKVPAREATHPARAENKVPEWAEDMEHSLRRLIRERDRRRSKSPGLYL